MSGRMEDKGEKEEGFLINVESLHWALSVCRLVRYHIHISTAQFSCSDLALDKYLTKSRHL